jgi:predicted ATPase
VISAATHRLVQGLFTDYYQNTALYPVIELMQRALRWQREDAPEEKLRKLEEALTRYGMAPAEVVPLLAPLLSLPGPAKYPALTLNPQRQRQKTLEAVLAVLLRLAEQQPLLMIVEDLHWIDPSTLELLGLLIDTDGIPLFVEELTKMVLESGLLQEREDHYQLTGPLPPLAIPATLHDSLMARLDRLAAVKEVAQLGATLGRSFTYEVLRAVSLWDEATLQQALQQLVEAELLYQRGLPPQATYLFKHALVQETAYQSVLKSRRQQSHQRIAHVLEGWFPETAETQPELLAHHYTEAGQTEHAIPYWQRAAKAAGQRHAYREAIEYLKRALALLQAMAETPQLIRQELEVQLALGPALMVVRGFTAPEVADTYSRARQLCEQLGDRQQLFSVLFGLWRFSHVRAQLRTARGLGKQLVSLATCENDPALLVEAHGTAGQTEEGLHAVDEALAMVDTHGERIYEAELRLQQAGRGACPGVLPRDSSGVEVGQPARTEAEACFHQALDVARRQQARSVELRAAMSLSRLWQRQGQCAEAYELLAPIFGWFTEGFDTVDLQEAKALLEELS